MTNLPFLLIEFLDELVYGVSEAAWPFIQESFDLSYTKVGILLTVPGIISSIVEPFLGILGDVWKRKLLILGGGVLFTISLFLTGFSQGFFLLLLSFCLFYPASGAFVSLSQASLMDAEPTRHDQNMARWTFSGSFGVTLGPLLLVGLTALGFGWHGVFLALGLLAGLVVLFVWKRIPDPGLIRPAFPKCNDVMNGFRSAFLSLKNRDVFRWLTLLQFSDLMLDVLLGFLALYFHDVVGLQKGQAASAVLIWLVAGLVGDLLLIPLLEKVDGIRYLRFSVLLEFILFPAFLLVPSILWKLIAAGLLGFFNSGWYAILQGRLYTSMRTRSASVMTLSNLAGLVGGLLPLAIGALADDFGLNTAMWVLLAGPIALLLGIPWKKNIPNGWNNDN